MIDVTIQVSITHMMDGQTEHTVLESAGKAVKKESGWFCSYSEELEGARKVPTLLKISQTGISLLRQGHIHMKQEYQQGQQTESMYNTPHGRFRMEIYTRKLQTLRENGRPVSAHILYQQWLDGQYLGEYELNFRFMWKEA